MIDFSNASVFKLKKTDASKFDSEMRDILIEDEKIIGCYQDVRDHVVFTKLPAHSTWKVNLIFTIAE